MAARGHGLSLPVHPQQLHDPSHRGRIGIRGVRNAAVDAGDALGETWGARVRAWLRR